MNLYIDNLFKTVINNDYCIGCGVCAGYPESPLVMKINEDGKYIPSIENNNEDIFNTDVLITCPFSNSSKDENDIASNLYRGINGIKHSEYTGYYLKNYAGYVKEDEYRERGSSGGMGTWLATQLIKNGLADAVIHVKQSLNGKELFSYQVSESLEELNKGTKSKYYPIEMSKVIKYIRNNPKRYVLVGIPCFIKSIRLLAEMDEKIKESIKFTIGLVCGHLKTDMFAKSLAWEMGINPNQLKSIDFRMKIEGQNAGKYGIEAIGIINGKEVRRHSPKNLLYTTDWGYGFFKYKACDYCDDVLAETADVTVGDAWLPEYSKDSKGTNLIVIRNPEIMMIVENNLQLLSLDELTLEKVVETQSGGFRHRREGLAYRLYLSDKKNEWRPKKRIEAQNNISHKRKKIYEKRVALYEESYKAYKKALEKDDFNVFIKHMDSFVNHYKKLLIKPFWVRVLIKIKASIFKIK